MGPKLSDPTTFGDPTPYNIMFGPDKCGYTKRFWASNKWKDNRVVIPFFWFWGKGTPCETVLLGIETVDFLAAWTWWDIDGLPCTSTDASLVQVLMPGSCKAFRQGYPPETIMTNHRDRDL